MNRDRVVTKNWVTTVAQATAAQMDLDGPGGLCIWGRKRPKGSSARFLRAAFLGWCRRIGLLLVVRESRSCYRRIRRQWRKRSDAPAVMFDEIHRGLPQLPAFDHRTASQPYILGIQAIQSVRRDMGPDEIELFLQGWMLAESYASRTYHTAADRVAHP